MKETAEDKEEYQKQIRLYSKYVDGLDGKNLGDMVDVNIKGKVISASEEEGEGRCYTIKLEKNSESNGNTNRIDEIKRGKKDEEAAKKPVIREEEDKN